MGLRNASVRHPNVVVMAPALTETAQPRNFKIAPSSDVGRLSLSLKKLKRGLKDIVPVSLRSANPNVADVTHPNVGMNGHSPSKTTYTINGLSRSLKNEFVPIDKCVVNDPPRTTESSAAVEIGTKNSSPSSGDFTVIQIGGFMMNSSANSMGDNESNMGLQRPTQELSVLTDPDSSPSKEKLNQGEVDQLFKNLAVKPDELFESGSGKWFGQNVDDILQVFNNMTGNSGSELPTLGSTPSDGESMFPITSNDIAGSLTSLERELFNEVDMMNMCDESLNLNKESVLKDHLEEARKKQFQLRRKCEFLNRRLKKIQSRTLGKHVCDEVTGILEYTSNLYDAVNRSNKSLGTSESSVLSDVKCDVKGVRLSTLSLLMRQMEHSSNQQANYLARNSSKTKYFGAGSSTSASNGMRIPGTIIPSFRPEVKKEVETITGELQAQLTMIQSEMDSDLTESSSGCDSCDEFVSPSSIPSLTPHQPGPSVPLNKRAVWKYSVERCLVAGRWAWLQARISELDYKIRQANELRRQLRLAKGTIKLQAAPSNQQMCMNDDIGGCARTLTMVDPLRKRRLVRAEGLHLHSKRALRVTSIRCLCRGPPPCLLCNGRLDPTVPQDPTQNLPVPMRIALLDASFHPQLSFPTDVSQTIHYAAVMKCTDWQSKAGRVRHSTVPSTLNSNVRSTPLTSNIISVVAARDAVATLDDLKRPRVSISDDCDLPQLHEQTSSSSPTGFGFKKKNPRGRRKKYGFDGFKVLKSRKPSVTVEAEAPKTGVVITAPVSEPETSMNGGDKYLSPIPSPTPSKDQFRRKRENSYDIDNIVIPYCMAASTRPEKLHYKEILTPKWRLVKDELEDSVEGKNGAVRRPSHEFEGDEDISEEFVVARHARCEEEEKKKFLSYMKINRGGRGQRRTDSRAESSGPNTPVCVSDPLSPAGARESGNSMDSAECAPSKSPRASTPPPLPPPPLIPQSQSIAASVLPLSEMVTPLSSQAGYMTRKRTISGGSNNQPKSPPLPLQEIVHYEPRIFPLPDEVFEKMLLEQRESLEYPPEEERPLRFSRYTSEYGMFLGSSEEES